jgi:hypothetical protein
MKDAKAHRTTTGQIRGRRLLIAPTASRFGSRTSIGDDGDAGDVLDQPLPTLSVVVRSKLKMGDRNLILILISADDHTAQTCWRKSLFLAEQSATESDHDRQFSGSYVHTNTVRLTTRKNPYNLKFVLRNRTSEEIHRMITKPIQLVKDGKVVVESRTGTALSEPSGPGAYMLISR